VGESGGGVRSAERLLLVVNRSAGTAEEAAVAAAVERLRVGADVAVAATADAAELDDVVAARNGRRLVVLGGDGSVHAVVRALDRAGALDPAEPLGIIAAGTGNDLARALGLPLDPVEGAATVLTGTPRSLDLLRDDAGGLVINAVHAGIGARAGAAADRLKDTLGAVAYPLGAASAGVTSSGWALRVTVDGRIATHPTSGWRADGSVPVLMLGVCNGSSIGGGAPLAPDALPDDGLADVVISSATGPIARVAFAAALVSGRHVERDDVLVVRGRTITLSGGPLDLDADGEIERGVQSRTWRVHPAAWSVPVPV
jgi:diacylglycerol kinase family enzyme